MTGHNGVPARQDVFANDVADVVRDADLTQIVVSGDLDMSTVTRVRLVVEGARESGPEKVVVDLSGVEFVDSHGLQLLADTHRALTADGCPVVVVPPAGPARRAFELTGLDWLFGDESVGRDGRLAFETPDR
jgi:anti-anti-sigma factor